VSEEPDDTKSWQYVPVRAAGQLHTPLLQVPTPEHSWPSSMQVAIMLTVAPSQVAALSWL
jgi:hypothetical protein